MTDVCETIDATTYRMGATLYDTSGAEVLYGADFDILNPTPLSRAEETRAPIVVLGTVFEVASKESRQGDRITCTIGISDGASGIYLDLRLPTEEGVPFIKQFKSGMHLAVLGSVTEDKFHPDPYLKPRGIKKIGARQRTDDAKEKRVELHLHSRMSQMDAMITPQEIVNTAIRWGHPVHTRQLRRGLHH